MFSAVLLGTLLLGGNAGEKMNALFAERIFSADARGKIYEEAVAAFRTHYDDVRTPQQEGSWTKGKGLWQGEYWGKSMLAAASVADYLHDKNLTDSLRAKALAFVREFQQPDGYLCSYRDPHFVGGPIPGGTGEVFCWNLWGRKYTMWALIEIARISHTSELLAAAARMMGQEIAQLKADHIKIENTGYFVGLPSMSVLKPLILLYQATHKAEYLAFADEIVAAWERPGNPAPNLIANAFGEKLVSDWYANPSHWAKAYEMMSCLEGLVAYAELKHEPRILEAVKRIVTKLEDGELNAVGSVGFFDHFTHAAACPNATTEPCDITHWIRINAALFQATDNPHYLDTIEFAFLNGFLAGVYRDGKWGAHSVRSHGTRHRTAPHQVGMAYHQCCIDNMPRTFVDYADAAVTRGKDGSLSVNLYSDMSGNFGTTKVAISGGFPFSDRVIVKISAPQDGTIRFRNPGWCDRFTLNGAPVTGAWARSTVKSGPNEFALVFTRHPQIVNARACVGTTARAGQYEVENENPEMKGLARNKPAARLIYGPLLLAKAKRVGDTRQEILAPETVNGRGFTCSLQPLAAPGVNGAWKASFVGGSERFAVNVCDFASAADEDDPNNLFSIWF